MIISYSCIGVFVSCAGGRIMVSTDLLESCMEEERKKDKCMRHEFRE